MSNYILSCCSTADLTKEHMKEKNLNYVNFHYTLNGVEYPDDLGQTQSFEEFYSIMRKGNADTKTSQVNVSEYMEYFKPLLEQGNDILHVCLSSGISGSHNSALVAKDLLLEEFPDRKLIIIDSLAGAAGLGLLMDTIADMKADGVAMEDLATWVEENKLTMNHYFYSTDLTYFVKGGRLSKTSGLIGSALNINPILILDKNGKILATQKVIGKKRAQKKVIDLMIQGATNGLGYSEKCFISHSDMLEDAQVLAAKIEETFKNLKGKVVINSIGTTIGAHTGPGTIALFYWGDKRVE